MLILYVALLFWLPLVVSHPLSIFSTSPPFEARRPGLFARVRNALISLTPGQSSARTSHLHASEKLGNLLSTPTNAVKERYDKDIVLRFNISTAEEAVALAEAADTLFLDVWDFTAAWADIRLAKDVVPSLLALLPTSMQRAHTPLMHDLARTVYESLPSPPAAELGFTTTSSEPRRPFSASLETSSDEVNLFFRDYQPLSVISPWMRLMQSMFPTHVRLVNLGSSYEGRDILAFRVGVHPQNSDKPPESRKTILVSGGAHAREWISVSAVNYAAYSMITSYGQSREMTKLMEEFDWVFIPTLNPDGYAYSWEVDRLWRKNSQETVLRFCRGLDIDRSFGFEWDGERTKGNPCSESFAGDAPFQATEALRLADWVKNETRNNNVDFIGYLDLHSYSQLVLYPYSYSCIKTPPTLENLEEVALGLSKAMKSVSGEVYGVTSACEGSVVDDKDKDIGRTRRFWTRIESSGGTALDWMYHEANIRYSYQIKLRDTGTYGFLLPKKYIVPTGEEIAGALKFFGKYLLSNKGVETIDDSPSSKKLDLGIATTSHPGGDGADQEDLDGVAVDVDDYETSQDLRR